MAMAACSAERSSARAIFSASSGIRCSKRSVIARSYCIVARRSAICWARGEAAEAAAATTLRSGFNLLISVETVSICLSNSCPFAESICRASSGRPRSAKSSTPDRQAAGLDSHAPGANCLLRVPRNGGKRSRKVRRTQARRLSYRSVHCARARPDDPYRREAARPDRCSNRERLPMQRLPPACPERIRAALSSGAASRRKRVQLKIKIRMAGGNHFVIYKFIFCSQMAFQAAIRAVDDVARVVHAKRDGFFVRPVFCGVRAEPCGRGAVAIFAGDAVSEFKCTAALFRRGIERVAG